MIKVLALDLYETILAMDDPENSFPPREGLPNFLNQCKDKKIITTITSDANPEIARIDMQDTFSSHPKLNLSINQFDKFFQLNQIPVKDYSIVAGFYDIAQREILVIGDSYKDIGGAIKYGCAFLQVPEYRTDDLKSQEFDFSKIYLSD